MTQCSSSTTKALATDQTFTVMMHRTLVDDLDDGFSPMDGLVAIDQMFNELPLLHRTLAPKHPRKRPVRKLTVYRGRYAWYPNLAFCYVQIGQTLHVLDLWYDETPALSKVDVVLGTGQTEGYKPFDTDQTCTEEEEDSSF
ncbi:MAG: hypothetical protein LC104_06040 [Bacteroidales bacterium]|nr:hypothetical protein [Bacteroidales bacterium]